MFVFAMLIITLVFIFIINNLIKRDLNLPSNYLIGTFILGSFFALLGNIYWEEKISGLLYVVIVLSIISFIMGENLFYERVRMRKEITVKKNRLLQIMMLSFISVVLNIYFIFLILSINGYNSDLGSIWYLLRIYKLYGEDISNYFISLLVMFSHAAGYISLYFLILRKSKSNIFLHLVIIFLMIINFILSTDRSNFIALLFYIIYLLIFQSNKLKFKQLLLIAVIGVITLAIFIYFATQRNISGGSIFEGFLIYSGSSIVALNKFLANFNRTSNYFGEETFSGIRILINRFYPAFYEGKYFLENITFNNGANTNIYTGIRSFIHDFGIVGNFVIMVLLGTVFGYFSKYRKKPLFLIIFAYYISKLSFLFLAPSITAAILTITQIFQIIFIILIYKVFYRESELNTKESRYGI